MFNDDHSSILTNGIIAIMMIMTRMIIMKVGVFLENNVLPHSKPTKQGHWGACWA